MEDTPLTIFVEAHAHKTKTSAGALCCLRHTDNIGDTTWDLRGYLHRHNIRNPYPYRVPICILCCVAPYQALHLP